MKNMVIDLRTLILTLDGETKIKVVTPSNGEILFEGYACEAKHHIEGDKYFVNYMDINKQTGLLHIEV